MLNMNWKLEQREKEGKIIKTGIVGAGQMGRGMVTISSLITQYRLSSMQASLMTISLLLKRSKKRMQVSQQANMSLARIQILSPRLRVLSA